VAIVKRKRKLKPYQAQVYVSGVRVATQSFETKAAATVWHERMKREFEAGYGSVREMTLLEVIRSYKERELGAKVVSTKRRRKGRLKLIEECPLGDVMMRDFDGVAVDRFLGWLARHPRATTPTRKSFVEELKTLSLVLGHYRDYYDAQFVGPITKRHRKAALFKGPLEGKAKDFYLPVEHARKWFQALARAKNPAYHDLGMVQLILGLRIGEACALCDDAVDFERGVLTIKRTMEWVKEDGTRARAIVDRTKTKSSRRELPIPAEIAKVLRGALRREPAVLHRAKNGKMVQVVFHMPNGRLMCRDNIGDAYGRAFEAAGLPWKGTHICRDTNATLGLCGGSLEAVRVNHGHASVVETEGYARIHAMVENTVPESVARQLFGGEEKNHCQNHCQTGDGGKKGKEILGSEKEAGPLAGPATKFTMQRN
jgi:integrase